MQFNSIAPAEALQLCIVPPSHLQSETLQNILNFQVRVSMRVLLVTISINHLIRATIPLTSMEQVEHLPITSCCLISSLGTSGFSNSLRNSSKLSASPPFFLFLSSSGTRGVRQRVNSYQWNKQKKLNTSSVANAKLELLFWVFLPSGA